MNPTDTLEQIELTLTKMSQAAWVLGLEKLATDLQELAVETMLCRKRIEYQNTNSLEKLPENTITITVHGGVVEEVDGLPPGFNLEINDLD